MTTPSVHKTTFNPNQMQRAFIESRAEADLFSSRMGEGKSTALAWSALYHTRHNPGAKWVIIRDTFENLQHTTMKSFFEWFPPGVYGTYHGGLKTFTWASGIAEGTVTFMGLDDPTDSTKLMSREMAGFAIDEPAPGVGNAGVAEEIFTFAMSRLRQQGMKWYGAKLAENNPDEAHWTYAKFVSPGTPGYKIWQPNTPENIAHLPANYYEKLRVTFNDRPDLIRRFVDGEFGFQQIGKSVTPQWNDRLHLTLGLGPIPRGEIVACWDFGLNPTCILTQRTPVGNWNVLDSFVGDGIGVEELIELEVLPVWVDRYGPAHVSIRHIGDPAGTSPEQTNSKRTAVNIVKRYMKGPWRSGPIKPIDRIEPLRSALTRTVSGRGMIQVDRHRAPHVWHALRGGWHHHIARTGLVSGIPVKDIHSHPGDALSYGAAVLFPAGQVGTARSTVTVPDDKTSNYFTGRSRGKEAAARALGAGATRALLPKGPIDGSRLFK